MNWNTTHMVTKFIYQLPLIATCSPTYGPLAQNFLWDNLNNLSSST